MLNEGRINQKKITILNRYVLNTGAPVIFVTVRHISHNTVTTGDFNTQLTMDRK